MTTEECKSCEMEFELEEMVELQEHSELYYCHECLKDLNSECPRCGGVGCNHCLMLEW